MPTALSENAANADFGTGLPVPANGDNGSSWGPQVITALQELADRTQAVSKESGVVMSGGAPTKKVLVPTGNIALRNSGEFTYTFSSGAHYWQQTSTAAAGSLTFEVPQLPIGAKITGAYAWIAYPNNTTLPVGTMPALSITKNVYSVGANDQPGTYDSTVASASDATAVSATYKLMHKVAITGLSETVAEDVVYRITFSGETGANATGSGNMAMIVITLGV